MCLEGYRGRCINVVDCQVYGVNATGVMTCRVCTGTGIGWGMWTSTTTTATVWGQVWARP